MSSSTEPGHFANPRRPARLSAGTRVEHAMTSNWRGTVQEPTGRGFYRIEWDDGTSSDHHGDCLLTLPQAPAPGPR